MMKHRPKIYIFGNEMLKEDSLPLKIKPLLQNKLDHLYFEFRDPTENLWPTNGRITLIDTAENIEEIMHIDNLEKVQTLSQPCSVHDMDLSFHLKLLWKIGELKKVDIIAVPAHYSQKKATEEVADILLKLYPINP